MENNEKKPSIAIGEVFAQNQTTAQQQIQLAVEQGINTPPPTTPTKVTPAPAAVKENTATAGTKKRKKKFHLTPFNKVPVIDIIMSIKHLSIMLRSSMAIEDTLKVLSEQTANKSLKMIYQDVLLDVQGGLSLSEALEKYDDVFSNVIISIVKAGEQGGSLEKNLTYLADYIKKDYELKKKVKGALFYPIFILAFSMAEMLGFIFVIIPKLEPFFRSMKKTPTFTRMLLDSSKFIRDNKFIILGVIIAIVIIVRMYFKSNHGKHTKDLIALKFPIISNLTKQSIIANFSRTLGILLESGIAISQALQISATTVGNGIYGNVLTKVYEKVKSGETLATSLEANHKYFPQTFIKLVSVGEETGSLEDNLLYLHQFYSDEVTEMSNNMATMLEPIMMVFIGLVIGGLAISLILPIFQVTSSLG